MTTANNPVVTAVDRSLILAIDKLRTDLGEHDGGRSECVHCRIFDHINAAYGEAIGEPIAMTQASPREPTATEREALHMAHRASAEVVEYLAPPDEMVVKRAIAEAMQDLLDGKPSGCIVVKGCEAANYVDPEDAADAFIGASARAALQSIGPLTGWQPIETAPKDGTWIQLLVQGAHPHRVTVDHLFVTIGRWRWSPDARLPHDQYPDDGGWLEVGNEWDDDWGGNIGWLYWTPLAVPPPRAALKSIGIEGQG